MLLQQTDTVSTIVSLMQQARESMSKREYLSLCESVANHCHVEWMEESGEADRLSRTTRHGKDCDCRDCQSMMGIPV